MEASEITRRNEAIAKYDGWGSKDGIWWEGDRDGFPFLPEMLDFHESWGRIMPVVEKIIAESKDAFHILPSHSGGFVSRFGVGQNRRGDTPIEATWMAVSDYILEKK